MESVNTNKLVINLENYSGPLEVLLDLAKSQKVNLAEISITRLADQFLGFINQAKKINLDLAAEYLLMATWLAYLKSKLLLPEADDDDFHASEVAEKLKTQLKKLELIRLLSSQLLKRKKIGVDVFFRGQKGTMRSIHSLEYKVTLYDLLKSYSNFNMRKNFMTMTIPKLAVYTTEEGINIIKGMYGKLKEWRNISEFIPKKINESKDLKKSFIASMLAASLELSKEGDLVVMQKKLFDKVFIKEKT